MKDIDSNLKLVIHTARNSSNTVTLKDTLYVPDVRTNLISVAKIVDKGNAVTFTKDGAFVKDSDGNVKISADCVGDLFYIRGKNEVCAVTAESAVKNESESWHARLGHLNASDMLQMQRSGCVKGLD